MFIKKEATFDQNLFVQICRFQVQICVCVLLILHKTDLTQIFRFFCNKFIDYLRLKFKSDQTAYLKRWVNSKSFESNVFKNKIQEVQKNIRKTIGASKKFECV